MRAAYNSYSSVTQGLQALVDRHVAEDPAVRNAALLVEDPRQEAPWKVASGLADPETRVAMSPDDQFRSASVGKMVCAITVLTFAEDGDLDLDGEIGVHLPETVTAGLHEYEGHSYGKRITIRQLLGHTSGLPNYFRLPEFQQLLVEEPDKLWEPAEVVEYTKTHASALFPPGQGWHYADTGYLLLGLIVETLANAPLHEVYRRRLFKPLGMHSTYMAFREQPRGSVSYREPSHVFLGDLDYTEAKSLSADWAGGGMVTTAEDLNHLIRAFSRGRVFRNPATAEEMFKWVSTGESGVYYGLGIRRFVLEELGLAISGELWGHTGSSKSFMLYWPEADTTICGTLNQDEARGTWSELLPVTTLVPEVVDLLNFGVRLVPKNSSRK